MNENLDTTPEKFSEASSAFSSDEPSKLNKTFKNPFGHIRAEGSVIAAVVSVLFIWYIWQAKWIKPSDENGELWKKYPASYGVSPVRTEMQCIY